VIEIVGALNRSSAALLLDKLFNVHNIIGNFHFGDLSEVWPIGAHRELLVSRKARRKSFIDHLLRLSFLLSHRV